mmetsp:Transcript_7266/g.12435  ORF Transcript_7266/g.12435 Transcript_7266/m.12435 type:complete len:655 (+) Transcript_7266:82-2046(+)
MVVYNFKRIQVVPTAKDFIDIILSKTQRKTPTVVHKHYAINRIRQFYMKKIKFTQQNFDERLGQILQDFPRLEDIHPFYADLLNVLYDKDHYKLALGQLNTAKHLIDNIGKDYLRMLKYGDSLYRCKQLKKAGLGRMCTLMKKQTPSLAYLEQVRQHMARLPSIDPNTRTLLICGYPNVGKSSFMNKLTRANVDVQPYAFTTKSLFVGHMDYKFLRWQVIDTPGILDHPLEERNTIEMQSVTALAHLRAAVLFFLDISEQCGFPLKDQVALFQSIKPLFANKPLVVVLNKVDLMRPEDLKPEDKALLDSISSSTVQVIPMSNLSEEGVSDVKTLACDKLLELRVESKISANKTNDILNRIHLAVPSNRDTKARPPVIPETVAKQRSETDLATSRVLEKDLMLANGGAGVYGPDLRKHYQLKDPEWKYDIIPEIIDGKNIADYVDPEILARLEELEREEDEAENAAEDQMEDEQEAAELTEQEEEQLQHIRKKRKLLQIAHRIEKNPCHAVAPERTTRQRTRDQFEDHLKEMGFDEEKAQRVSRSRSQSAAPADGKLTGKKRGRSASRGRSEKPAETSITRRARSLSVHPRDISVTPGKGFQSTEQKVKAIKIKRKVERKRNDQSRKGEADRHVPTLRPKHLLTGKRGVGKTDRR